MTSSVPSLDKNNRTANVYSNGDKILFEPLFGYAQYVPLPDSKRKIYNLSELTTEELGKNVKEVLANSRVLDRSEINDFFDNDRIEKEDLECLEIMIKLFGKRNKASLYKSLMKCPLHLQKGILSMRPTKHDRSEWYSGLSINDKELVYIPLNSSDEDIGNALKLAFTRCTGVGAFEFHKKLRELGWE